MAHRSKLRSRQPAVPVPAAPEPPPPPPPARPWRRRLAPLLVLWALAVLAYSNSFRDGLVYDNQYVVATDTRVHEVTAENLRLIFTKDYWYKNSTTNLYRPLVTLSYLFNYAVLRNGESPAGYHAVNLLLHAANIGLVYLLGWLLMAEFWPAFAMAALWAVHPVLTESITNIVGRADELAALGVLVGLLCFVRGLTAVGRRAALWQAGVLAASAVAIFSKESGIAVIAVIFLYDLAWRPAAPRRSLVIGYLAAALPIVVFLMLRAQVLKDMPLPLTTFADNPLVATDFWTARLTALKVLGRYLWLLLWPAWLSCDYSYNQIPLFSWNLGRWEDCQALLSAAVYCAAAALALYSYRRSKPVFFLIGFFFAAMAPTANLFLLIGTIMAERVLYLPSIGFAGLAAWAGWTACQRLRPRWPALRLAAPGVLALVCLVFCARTFARNFDWHDDRSLWASAERACPASYRPHQHRAEQLANSSARGLDAAAREAEQAIAITRPLSELEQNPLVFATAGFCYRLKGEQLGGDGGAAWYRKALDVLLQGKKVDQAWDREFQRRNREAGKSPGLSRINQLYLELARTYRDLGQYQNALAELNPPAWPDPKVELFEEMSRIYRAQGDVSQAAVALLEGITMGVSNKVLLASEVVELYRQTAPESCALTGSGTSAALNFECPMVRGQFCQAGRNAALIYRRMHRDQDAVNIAVGSVQGLGCPAEMFR